MSSSSVWVQLYYKGDNEPQGRPTSVKKAKDVEESEWNIDALAKAVKVDLNIDNVPINEIFVYPPGTKPPFSQDKAFDPGAPVPTGSASRHPLIVVAPKQETPNFKSLEDNGTYTLGPPQRQTQGAAATTR